MSRFIVQQAKTHRRGGLQVARETYAGSSLFGWMVSPYTAKVRAHLAYKNVTFSDVAPSAFTIAGKISPAVGRVIMPTVQLADGTWRQDSALICDEIDREHPEPSTRPTGAAQQMAASLLELHADEWLPMLALHYRWDIPENAAWAQQEFGRSAFPLLPSVLSEHLAKPIADRMRALRSVHYGPEVATMRGIEAHATLLIAALETHLSSGAPYLLGGRASRGDFALYGPLWAHLYRDPGCREQLFGEASHVVQWMERLHGHASDPAFPTMPCRIRRIGEPEGQFLPSDHVPEALDPLFRALFAEHWEHLRELSAALDAHLDEQAAAQRTDVQPVPGEAADSELHVPRALGSSAITVGGHEGCRRLLTYSAWRLQRPLDLYNQLQLAPSRSLELDSVNKWLLRLGALDTFASLRPRWRLERESALPNTKERFRARRAT